MSFVKHLINDHRQITANTVHVHYDDVQSLVTDKM